MKNRILVGTRKGLFTLHRDRSAATGWRMDAPQFLGDPVSMVLSYDRGRRVLCALDHGHFGVKLHRSDDGGRSFEEVEAPRYPDPPEGVVELDPFKKIPVPWSTQLIWSLAAGHPDHEGEVWCGTIPGGLFRSRDHGGHWEIVDSLWSHPDRGKWVGGGMDFAGLHSIVTDPRDPDALYVGVSCGGTWKTKDQGASWTQSALGMRADYAPPEMALIPDQQDPHCVVRAPSDFDRLWCQHHNGIFRSDDDGDHWIEVKNGRPSSFGFPVAVHPKNADCAWFVPAVKDEKRYPLDGRLCLSRTRDAGETFEVLDHGLPTESAYDLTLRHALDVDDEGAELVFGTTTGNLFLGHNEGAEFSVLSHHLPPIYVTRFAD